MTIKVGKDLGNKEHLSIVGRSIDWQSHYRNYSGSFMKCQKLELPLVSTMHFLGIQMKSTAFY